MDNPLLGERGAAQVYAPQKGATPEQVRILDAGLAQLAAVIAVSYTHLDVYKRQA